MTGSDGLPCGQPRIWVNLESQRDGGLLQSRGVEKRDITNVNRRGSGWELLMWEIKEKEDRQIIPDLECESLSLKTSGLGLDGGRSR